MTNEEKYKLAAFLVVRNTKVLPVGLAKGKSMQEINQMARDTLESIMNMIDFDVVKKHYEEAEGEERKRYEN